MVQVRLHLQAGQQRRVRMQCHLLMKQLAASFKEFAQFSQHTLAEICLLEAVIATHLGLISTQTLHRGCQKFSVIETKYLYLLRYRLYFFFLLPHLKRQLLISEAPQTALCALTFGGLRVQLCVRLGQLSSTAPVVLQEFGQFVVFLPG